LDHPEDRSSVHHCNAATTLFWAILKKQEYALAKCWFQFIKVDGVAFNKMTLSSPV
jgi:hypothetical protein